MKPLPPLIPFVLLLLGLVQLPALEVNTELISGKEVIAKLIKESVEKINELDLEGSLRHVHPTAYNEYTHLPQKDLVEIDRKSMIEFCKAVFPSLGVKVSPPVNLMVRIKGDMAYATYRCKEQFGTSPSITVRRTEIYLLEKGNWLLTHSHRSIMQEE